MKGGKKSKQKELMMVKKIVDEIKEGYDVYVVRDAT